MSVLALDRFKFLGVEVDGSEVLAKISQRDILSRQDFSRNEEQIHRWLEDAQELTKSGEASRKVLKNRDQILAAFNAIRTCKAQNGIPFDVKEPCV